MQFLNPLIMVQNQLTYGQAAKCPGRFWSSGGTASAHEGWAIGQRVLNPQPLGLFMGVGTSPFKIVLALCLRSGLGSGTADSNALL
jgi:hypothetical protein